MRSIKSAIVTRLVWGTAALLLIGAVAFTFMARRLLTEQFDAASASKLRTFTALFEQEGRRIELDLVTEFLPEFEAGEDAEYFQVWHEDRELGRSDSLGELELPRNVGTEAAPATFDLTLADGRAGRAIGAAMTVRRYERTLFADPGPAEVAIVLARSREGLNHALAILMGASGIGIVVLVLGGLFLGRRVADRGLEPVADLVAHVERIDDPTQARTFRAESAPVELQPIATGLNQLVERLALLLQRERRTSANIAHELRTPVSELLITAEVALRFGNADELRAALEEVCEVGQQMRRMIHTLLELARIESGQTMLKSEPVDLTELVESCWQPYGEQARARALLFGIEGDGAEVTTDRSALSILVSNLLGNAAEHAPEGTRVECALAGDDGPHLTLSNSANGLKPEDLDKLTEPFWRASEAREDRDHAGLGLALSRRLAELLDLELTFTLEGGVFRADLSFPR